MDKEDILKISRSITELSPERYSLVLIIPILSLIAGFLIWHIFLNSLGFIENDLIRPRFVLTGIAFILYSYIGFFLCKQFCQFLKNIWRWLFGKKVLDQNATKKAPKRIAPLHCVLTTFWLLFYALFLFPHIPLLFGGGQPRSISFVANEEGMKILNSLEIKTAEGGKFQTENICVAYENTENVIIVRKERILSIKKSMIYGFGSVPGIKAILEQDCIQYASSWTQFSSIISTQAKLFYQR